MYVSVEGVLMGRRIFVRAVMLVLELLVSLNVRFSDLDPQNFQAGQIAYMHDMVKMTYKRKEERLPCATWSEKEKGVRGGRARASIEEEVKEERERDSHQERHQDSNRITGKQTCCYFCQ